MPDNGELNYTPNTIQQTIPAGYTSGGSVSGDSNLIPENIKKDIQIFDVIGTYEGLDTSDADATADDIVVNKTAYVNGQKVIGNLPLFPNTRTFTVSNAGVTNNIEDSTLDLTTINTTKQILDSNVSMNFNADYSDVATAIDLTADKLKKDEVVLGITGTYEGEGVDIYDYFNNQAYGAFSLRYNIIQIPEIDTSTTTRMASAFEGFNSIKTIPQLNTSNVTDMSFMFKSCGRLQTIPQIDTSNVTNFESMFEGCNQINNLPTLDLSSATNVTNMFKNCVNLTEEPTIINLNTNLTDMNSMFEGCSLLYHLPDMNTSNITKMQSLCKNCSSLVSFSLDTSNVINFEDMFSGCIGLISVLSISFDNAGVLINMFSGCNSLSNTSLENILAALSTATRYIDTKTLKHIGLSETQATTCTTLSNWAACEEAGWTTGY